MISVRWVCTRAVRIAVSIASVPLLVKNAFAGWSYGDPEDPANLQGPQISRRQQERVLGYIDKGKADGARCLDCTASHWPRWDKSCGRAFRRGRIPVGYAR